MKFNTIKFFEHVIGIGQQIQGEEIQKNCTVEILIGILKGKKERPGVQANWLNLYSSNCHGMSIE